MVSKIIIKQSVPSQYLFAGGYVSFSSDTMNGYHYYIQDYMGSNRMVVNGQTGATEQVTHYYPYGGVIGDISTNQNLQTYKFEGKELDRTFGLDWYDIHARQYDAIGVPGWNKPDQLAEKYYGISPYVMCAGNPVNQGDYNGKKIFFINGQHGGDGGSAEYWEGVDQYVMNLTKDYNAEYLDGAIGGWMNTLFCKETNNTSSCVRQSDGYTYGSGKAKSIYEALDKDETIKVVTHSMGSAYGKGFVQSIVDYANENGIVPQIEFELDLAPYQPSEQTAVDGVITYQASHTNDIIATSQEINNATKTDITEHRPWCTSSSPIKNYVLQPHNVRTFIPAIERLLQK